MREDSCIKNQINNLFRQACSFFIVVAFLGCAEPKYIKILPSPDGGQEAQENPDNEVNCEITFPKLALCLNWVWEKKPSSFKDLGIIVFKTYKLNVYDQTPVEVDPIQTPKVVLWMPEMFHGSAETKIVRLDQGTYRVTNMSFYMPGVWDIQFEIRNGSEVIDETRVRLQF